MKIFVAVVILSLVCSAHARIYTRCELVRDLLNHGFARNDINNWVCLVEHESSRNTDAVNTANADGSVDYGLFQINSRYWCGIQSAGNGCNIKCQSLLNYEGVAVAAPCVKHIWSTTNHFDAWMGWQRGCKGQQIANALGECGM